MYSLSETFEKKQSISSSSESPLLKYLIIQINIAMVTVVSLASLKSYWKT